VKCCCQSYLPSACVNATSSYQLHVWRLSITQTCLLCVTCQFVQVFKELAALFLDQVAAGRLGVRDKYGYVVQHNHYSTKTRLLWRCCTQTHNVLTLLTSYDTPTYITTLPPKPEGLLDVFLFIAKHQLTDCAFVEHCYVTPFTRYDAGTL
jgi:hypothetical protein